MTRKRILFAVLNWGLGHATRSTSLIAQLIDEGNEVILAGGGVSLRWLKQHFPHVQALEKPQAEVHYARHLNGLYIAFQTPRFLRAVKRERQWTDDTVQRYGIDVIYSDNCYGVYHPACHSVLITHQLHLPVPLVFRPAAGWVVRALLRHFDEIMVPDRAEEPSLSGCLGRRLEGYPITYIGWLSHYTMVKAEPMAAAVPLVGMVSGPEPHRTLFEKEMAAGFRASGRQAAIFCGTAEPTIRTEGNITFYGNAPAGLIKGHLLQAEAITCRSGYSTLMDLNLLGVAHRIVRLVPTPGQREQVYLAKRHRPVS